MRLPILPLVSPSKFAAGASLAQLHAAAGVDKLAPVAAATNLEAVGELLLLDFTDVASATSSYIRALVSHFIPHHGGSPDLNVYPVLMGLSSLVQEEVSFTAATAGVVMLEARSLEGETPRSVVVHGKLDAALEETFAAVSEVSSTTAPELFARIARGGAVTAFNNRLSDLHARRLLRRQKVGRQWVYETICKEFANG